MIGQCKRESFWTITCLLVLTLAILTRAANQEPIIGPGHVHVISGGFPATNRVYVKVGLHVFYDKVPNCPATAGLYVVGIYENEVLLQYFYHTFQIEGASEGMARDIESLPEGTLVMVAAKDEPTKFFDQRGQEALLSIGAHTGLLGQTFRTSYLCIGYKGAEPGSAIERISMQEVSYRGYACHRRGCPDLIFPEPDRPEVATEPGIHAGLRIGSTEVIYYIPSGFDPNTAEYFFGIHGAGDWHRPGAIHRINQFKHIAERDNLVLIAPAFDAELNWDVLWPDDFDDQGRFQDPRIVKNRYLWDFTTLLNNWSNVRADQRLIEIFDLFNQQLMARQRFHLYGHSGGGQFVVRFALFYPELLNKVAASSPGTFTFPRFDIDYPHGLNMTNLHQTYPVITDYNDIDLDPDALNLKLNAMLDLNLILTVGELETRENHPDLAWQGFSTLDKCLNFYDAMFEQDRILKDQGLRHPDSPFGFELHVLPDVGHDARASGAAVADIMFPSEEGNAIDVSVLR